MLLLCIVFFIAALGVQFRHDRVSKSFKETKIRHLDRQYLHEQMPLSSDGTRTNAEVMQMFKQEIENTEARQRGDATPGSILYPDWVAEQKRGDVPTVMFLYGAGILFAFGAIITHHNKTKQSKRPPRVRRARRAL